MYVNSGGAGAGDCEGAAALEPNCANDQPVAKLLRDTLERLLLEYEVSEAVNRSLSGVWFGLGTHRWTIVVHCTIVSVYVSRLHVSPIRFE